jgi:hypothetical protein
VAEGKNGIQLGGGVGGRSLREIFFHHNGTHAEFSGYIPAKSPDTEGLGTHDKHFLQTHFPMRLPITPLRIEPSNIGRKPPFCTSSALFLRKLVFRQVSALKVFLCLASFPFNLGLNLWFPFKVFKQHSQMVLINPSSESFTIAIRNFGLADFNTWSKCLLLFSLFIVRVYYGAPVLGKIFRSKAEPIVRVLTEFQN